MASRSDGLGATGELHEPVSLDRGLALDRLLRLRDLGVDALQRPFRPALPVLVEDRPPPLVRLGSHHRRLYKDLVVSDRLVGMLLPPLLHLVGNIGDPGSDDERQAGVFDLLQVRLRHHPGIGDDRDLRQRVRDHERLQHRQDRGGLGGIALERVDLQREPAHIGQQTDGDLGFQPAFLGEPGLAEPVALVGLEIQRRDVVQHEGRRAETDMISARPASCCRHSSVASTGSRRLIVGYDGAAIPSSVSTRIESSLLVGSTTRANTSWKKTSSGQAWSSLRTR